MILVYCVLILLAGFASGWCVGRLRPIIVYRVLDHEVKVPFPVEKIVEVERVVERLIEVPVEKLVEVRVEVPVDRIVEKDVERIVEVEKVVYVDRPPAKRSSTRELLDSMDSWLLVLSGIDGEHSRRTVRGDNPPNTYSRPHGVGAPTNYRLVSVENRVAQYVEVA